MTNPPPLPGYYFWIRLVDFISPAMTTFGTGKPPKKTAYVPLVLPQDKPHRSACFHIGTDAQKPGTNQVFEKGQAFASEPEAEAWLLTAEGQTWFASAKNCVLVGFSFDIAKDATQTS
jgi:hypothetical protein